MKRPSALLAVTAIALAAVAKEPDSPRQQPLGQALLTLYSPHGPSMLEIPGRKSWLGRLWVDHQKIGLIVPGRFLTLKLPEGNHFLAGEGYSFFAKESGAHTDISLRGGERYFIRLVVESKAVAGIGPVRWIAEQVTCQVAYREAAAMEPVRLKRIEGASLGYVARESYFPECGK